MKPKKIVNPHVGNDSKKLRNTEEEMITAQRVSINSDLFICLGSSLAVFPAADLPLLAKETGANLVIVNNEPTQMDHLSDLVINRDISEVLSEISL